MFTNCRNLRQGQVNMINVLLFQVRDMCVSVSQEKLWNSSVVVLAPRQRVCQFAEDVWTRLWAALNDTTQKRLQPQAVIDKLRVSLHCYQVCGWERIIGLLLFIYIVKNYAVGHHSEGRDEI